MKSTINAVAMLKTAPRGCSTAARSPGGPRKGTNTARYHSGHGRGPEGCREQAQRWCWLVCTAPAHDADWCVLLSPTVMIGAASARGRREEGVSWRPLMAPSRLMAAPPRRALCPFVPQSCPREGSRHGWLQAARPECSFLARGKVLERNKGQKNSACGNGARRVSEGPSSDRGHIWA